MYVCETSKRCATWANVVLALMMTSQKTSVATVRRREDEVKILARQAIRMLADGTKIRPETVDQRLELLCNAFLDESDDPRYDALLAMRREGLAVDDIIDLVLPEIARIMGRRWAEDSVSFADVTIGAARLQETVRALGNKRGVILGPIRGLGAGPARRTPHSDDVRAPRILIVVPRPEHHTLGAFVLSDQLRRKGYEIDVAIDLHSRQVVEMMRFNAYSMVGITAAGRRSLASARELVDKIRTDIVRSVPIVLGGSVLGVEPKARTITGVDHIANTARDALRKCGLQEVAADVVQERVKSYVGG